MEEHKCLAVMAGRGALIAPWIFESWRTQKELLPTSLERVDIYRQLVSHMKVCDWDMQPVHQQWLEP